MTFYIRGRELWDAAPLADTPEYQKPRDARTLVLHHTAGYAPQTQKGAEAQMREIDKQHKGQGWIGIGYNLVMDRQGRVWEGRGLRCVGAHTKLHNTGTLGLSFMGDYSNGRLRLNRVQKVSYRLLRAKLYLHGFRFKAVKGHKEMPDQATACPGDIKKDLGLA